MSHLVRQQTIPNFLELIEARRAGDGGPIYTSPSGHLLFEAEINGERSAVQVFIRFGWQPYRSDGSLIPLTEADILKIVIKPRRELVVGGGAQ
ncbi:MAG TPA: hypothetical protein VHB46_04450 [Burkholderiales bacterium]|nr:hypothetical protein [Burkholderiales bacterium]